MVIFGNFTAHGLCIKIKALQKARRNMGLQSRTNNGAAHALTRAHPPIIGYF